MAESAAEGTPEVNTALLSLVLVFIPGIVCYGIIAALGEKKDRDNVTMFLQIFMYGVFSYLLLYLAHRLFPSVFPSIDAIAILKPADLARSAVDPASILWASVFGLLEGLLITFNLNRQILLKLCRRLGLTARFGDADVWTLLLNSTDTDNWVTIRHKERELIYQGYVSGFSSGGENRELLLRDVRVFSTDNEPAKVGEIPFLYMAFEQDDLILEFGAKPDKLPGS